MSGLWGQKHVQQRYFQLGQYLCSVLVQNFAFV
jgi:hypothetical protein